jgi:vacuolar-type H+-ATPase subunit H
MTVTAVVQRPDFEFALAKAREVGPGEDLRGLNAPVLADLTGRIEEAWDSIESGLRRAYADGREAAKDAVARATSQVESLLNAAGNKAKEVQDALVARLQTYVSSLISQALERVQPTIKIDTQTLPLVSVEVSQMVNLGGSLKVNLTEIINMTAEGQLIVNARYAGSA